MPSPSPTITSAVKLKRRPPLTTFATRLMATTRSRCGVFSWAGPPRPPSRRSRRSPRSPPPPSRRVRPGHRRPSQFQWCACFSELQPRLAGGVRQRGDAAVVVVTAAVEDDLVDAGFLGAGRDQLAHLGGAGLLVAVHRADVRLEARGRRHRVAGDVVDDLHDDVPRGAVDDHARTLGRAADLLAKPEVTTGPGDTAPGRRVLADRLPLGSSGLSHDHLPVFPTLRRIFSPA